MNDVINRKDAIGAILSVGHIVELSDGDAVIRVSAVNYVLRNLPSAQPVVISKSENTTECEDAVSRTEAVEALYDWEQMYTWDEHCKEDGGESPYIVSPSSIIEKLPPVTPKQPGWIPTSERLPKDFEEVLVWYEHFRYGKYNRMYQTYGVGYYNSEFDIWGGDINGRKVRVFAWMPLPTPYREGGQHGEG